MKYFHIKSYLCGVCKTPVWAGHSLDRITSEAEHLHDCMELMYVRNGTACCRINSRRYPARRGDLYVFAPGDIHELVVGKKLSSDTLLFSMEIFTEEEKRQLMTYPLFSSWCVPGDISEKKLSFSSAGILKLDSLFDDLVQECDSLTRDNGMLRKAMLIRLLFFTLDNGVTGGMDDTSHDLQLSSLFHFISQHYSEDLPLTRLARAAGVSPCYLNEFMHRTIGQGVSEYLTNYRVEQARMMLENGSEKVSNIAAATGFCDASHFIRVFRQHTGLTPGKYRKNFR